MKISVISPSFNQVQFLPDNLRTVSGQTGIELEHIIVDPGSTDGSTELARKATHAILINEPDRGQSHGITKGFQQATGDVLCWLNSDDMFPTNDTLKKVADAFEANPDADIIYGGVNFVGEEGEFLRKGFVNKNSEGLLKSFHQQVGIVQPGVFWRRKVFEELGGPSEDYNYCMDYEYWVRMADAGLKWVYIDEILAHHRWWSGMKTSAGRDKSLIEHFRVGMRYFGYIHWKWLDRYGEFRATRNDGVVNHAETIDQDAKDRFTREAILQFVTQDMLALLEKSDDPDHVETRAYIARIAPEKKRVMFHDEELPGYVSEHSAEHAHQRVAWHIFDTTVPGRKMPLKSYRVHNNFSRHFDADWYEEQHAYAIGRLTQFSQQRKDTCVVVANGPSLNKSNFALLDRADVILSNFAVINDRLRDVATYFTVVNDLVASQGSIDFNQLDIPRVVPFWLASAINPGPETVYLPATVIPEFNTRIDGLYSWRSTVSFYNMQLAYTLGYEKVVLIGFDHSYVQAVERKEGDAIKQKEEDQNHFDPRYFQGKTWQAADTDNMEETYEIAKKAYAAGGRTIVNATVGGKLEVFPRMALEEALPGKDPTAARHSAPPVSAPSVSGETVDQALQGRLPRLLVLDMTAMGNGTATGEVKSNLLRGWPEDRLMQLAAPTEARLTLVCPKGQGGFATQDCDEHAARSAIAAFRPEVILYRPLADRTRLHRLAMKIIDETGVPLVTWIMDDWPARLLATDSVGAAPLDRDLRVLLKRSALRLSISDAMSRAFETRYGVPFKAYANGVDPGDWPATGTHRDGPLLLRYAGGLAPDMNAQSVQRVARAVEDMAKAGMDIRFEINTMPWWIEKSGALFQGLDATRLESVTRSGPEYRAWIAQADALLIAYNFDRASIDYVRYSMANKLPECLVSGAALLAHGPRDVATVAYVAANGLGMVVDQDDLVQVKSALQALLVPSTRQMLANRGRAQALARHNLSTLAQDLARDISALCSPSAKTVSLPASDAAGTDQKPDFSTGPGAAFRVFHYVHGTSEPIALTDGKSIALPKTGVHALVLYEDPAALASSCITQGGDVAAALSAWERQAGAVLDMLRQAGRKGIIFERYRFVHAPEEGRVLLAQALPGCRLPAEIEAVPAPTEPLLHSLATQYLRDFPGVIRALAELRARGLSPVGPSATTRIDPKAAVTAWHNLSAYKGLAAERQTENEDLRTRLTTLEQNAKAQVHQTQLKDDQLRQLRATAALLGAEVDALQARLAAQTDDFAQVRSNSDRIHAEAEGLAVALDAMRQSTSWKATRPLRFLREFFSSRTKDQDAL